MVANSLRTALRLTGSRRTCVKTVSRASRQAPAPEAIAKRRKRRYCGRIRSARVSGVRRAPSEFHTTRSRSGLKKAQSLPPPRATLTNPETPQHVVLEPDEFYSFVQKKTRKRWVWVALCAATRQVVACVIGGRGSATCHNSGITFLTLTNTASFSVISGDVTSCNFRSEPSEAAPNSTSLSAKTRA